MSPPSDPLNAESGPGGHSESLFAKIEAQAEQQRD